MNEIAATMRYGIVAGLCLVTHNAIMILADRLGQPLLVGVGVSFCSVVIVGYLLHSRYTFAAPRGWTAFSRYVLAMAANLPVSTALLWILAEGLAWPMPLAAPAASCGMIALNVIMSRWAILGRVGLHPGRRSAVGGQTC